MLRWKTLRGYLLNFKKPKKILRVVLSFTLVLSIVFTDVLGLLTNGLNFTFKGSNFIGTTNALAATGDFAIFSELAGGEEASTSRATLDVTWDNTVQSNTNIFLQSTTSEMQLSEGGKYLVTYNTKVEQGLTTGSNRRSLNSWLTLDDVELPYGRASNYMRDTDGLIMTYLSGGTIIDASVDDILELHIARDDINPTFPTSVLSANSNGINVIKLKDSWDYLRLYNGATTSDVHLNTSFTDVMWQNADEVDTGSFGFTATSSDITLKGDTGDHFLVTANVTVYVDGTATTRQNYEMQLTLGGVPIPGTLVTAYPRGNQSSEEIHLATLSYMGIITKEAASDETLNLEMRRESSGSQVTDMVRNRSAISIVALPDTGYYVRLGDDSGNQALSNTAKDITWNTQYELDTEAFSHSTTTGSDVINIDKAGDYLFFATVRSTTTNGTNNRQPFTAKWKESGSTVNRGSFWGYNRNNGTNSTGGSGSVVLKGLTTSSYVEVEYSDESANAPSNAVLATEGISLQGILLDDNFYGTDVFITASGTRKNEVDIPTTNFYTGDQFVITEKTSSRNVTSINISESGSVDGANGLDNIKLYYDLDTTAPYDCASESYNGTESQYGSTDTNGFSGADGSSSFTEVVGISTTQALCLYPVVDVLATSTDGDTLEINIESTETDVVVTGGASIGPSGTVGLTGSTTLRNAELTQTHYHWRNDDGDETNTGATSVDGSEDTPAIGFANGTTRRLRVQVSAEGSTSSIASQFRLEYGQKNTTCSAIDTWTDVGTGGGGDWDVVNTANLTDGNDTTLVTNSSYGALTAENTTRHTPNGGQKDTSSQANSLTLNKDEYVELEYAIQPTLSAAEGNTYCFRLSDAGTDLRNYDVYAEGTISADIDVSALGSHTASVDVGSTNQYLGGSFLIARPGTSRTLTSITLKEVGTVDAANNLDNIKIYYDLDTTSPYDCAGESYNAGSDTQWGTTDTDGFSAENGTSTFTGSQALTSTQAFCGYVVLDVTSSAKTGETVEVQIEDPSTDVVVTSSSVGPSTVVSPTGSTTIAGPVLTQTHFHWRNDDGDETDTGATSATDGHEDTALFDVPKEITKRLRVQVSNEGSVTSAASQYNLEYGTKISSCENVSNWINVGNTGGAFDMSLSSNIADGNTTNINNTSNGAMTEENTTFVGTGALRETEATSSAITLTSTEYSELEYSIEATTDSGYDTTYCFRVSAEGSDLPVYNNYAELTTRQKQDFYVQRGTETITGTSMTLTAGVDYTAPSATTSAFVRITSSHMTGAGDNIGTNGQNADDVTAYISDQSDITSSFTIGRPSSATSNTRVDWEIVEFVGLPGTDNEIIVRRVGEVPFVSTEFTNSGSTTSNVADDSDVVVFITGQQNQDTDRSNYNDSLFTSEWNATTSQPDFERGDADVAADVSYAVVEFTGMNWKIQRVEHTYTAAGTTETESITAIGSISRTFLHSQKRVGEGLSSIDEGGHLVYISSIGAISFELQSGVNTPSGQTSVAWVLENTQTGTGAMNVYQSSGSFYNPDPEPATYSVSIGATVNTSNSSISGNNYTVGTGTTYPRLHTGFTIASSTHYEVYRSDTNNDMDYRVEVIEWPVAETSVRQNYYRFYVDNDALDPTDPWPAGAVNLGENTSITASDDPLGEGEVVRIRMSLKVNNATLPDNISSFKLQYGLQETTCNAINTWVDVGGPGSGTIWRGYDTAIADGTNLATSTPAPGTLNISVSDVSGTFEEQNNTTANPFSVEVGEDIEYDWAIEHNGAAQRSDYCFRMVNSDDTELDGYIYYPTLRTTGYTPVIGDWRWYDDETSATPSTALATENTAPIDIANQNIIKLRVNSAETENAVGTNIKFGLQYSQYADFSDGGTFVVSTSSCTENSIWCYADAAGDDNDVIQEKVITTTDACSLGVGNGCGTYNEAATTTSSFTHVSNAVTEFEFTIKNAGARANGVYYFRLYDVGFDDALTASSTYPSLVTEGPQLVSTISGVLSGQTIAGVTADVDTSPTSIGFGSLPLGTSYEAIQEININTNSTEGYQLFMQATQQLTNTYGEEIAPVNGDNDIPGGWSTVCDLATKKSCFGYHTTDATLFDGVKGRFAPIDSYASLDTVPKEIMYSSIPSDDTENIIYRIEISETQPAGDYETVITYISVPTF